MKTYDSVIKYTYDFDDSPIGEAFDCEIYFEYNPGEKGRRYMSNGDPGYPDEPPEIEYTAVIVDKSITDKTLGNWLLEKLWNDEKIQDKIDYLVVEKMEGCEMWGDD